MGNFNKFNKGRGDSRGFGGGSNYGGRREEKQLFPAVCGDCGNDCEVPFRPTGDHPVFCRDCFKGKGGFTPKPERKSFGGGNSSMPSAGGVSKAQFEALQAKVDKVLSLVQVMSLMNEPVKVKKAASPSAQEDMKVSAPEKKAKKVAKKAVKKTEAPAKKAKTTKAKKK